jgi:hypothetical protein
LYDPLNDTFVAAGHLNNGMGGPAIPLPDGTVLMTTGGRGAELYDPAAGTFTPTGSMVTPRFANTNTLLADGTVLMAGSVPNVVGGDGAGASAEIYYPAVLIPAPVLFSLSGDGRGQGAIWHAQTGQIASADNPAVAGEALSMYTSSLIDGSVIPPQVSIGGRPAEILFFGGAPGYPGYNQVNFRLPGGVASGPDVPVRLTYLSRPSNDVSIGVQ